MARLEASKRFLFLHWYDNGKWTVIFSLLTFNQINFSSCITPQIQIFLGTPYWCPYSSNKLYPWLSLPHPLVRIGCSESSLLWLWPQLGQRYSNVDFASLILTAFHHRRHLGRPLSLVLASVFTPIFTASPKFMDAKNWNPMAWELLALLAPSLKPPQFP